MATTANYASTPAVGIATLSAANTARDGTGTMVNLITAAANGTRIDKIVIAATATTTASNVTFFMSSATTATNTAANTHLLQEVPVTAVTPSATTAAFSAIQTSAINIDRFPIILASGQSLFVSQTTANALRVTATGGHF